MRGAKTQVCGRTKKQSQEVQTSHPEWFRSDLKVLGASTAGQARAYSPLEQTRIQDALNRAGLLKVVPLSWPLMIRAFQTFVISKASFGWVGKWPTQATTNKLFGRLTAALASSRGAALQLRKLFYGAITCLDVVVLTRTWSRVARRIGRGTWPRWNAAPRTDLSLLRKKLKLLGFQEQEPWLWLPARWPAAPGARPLELDLRLGMVPIKSFSFNFITSV